MKDDPIIEEYQPYKAVYDFGKGLITIDFSPEAMQFSIERGSYEDTLDRFRTMIDDCIRKSVNHLNEHQSISEPLK